MYHAHFSLREEPFGVTPDPQFFYRTAQHAEAVATVFYAIQQRRGFALLAGPPGLGKTSVLFSVVRMLKDTAHIAYLANPCYDRSTVLQSILASFGLETAGSPAANQQVFYQYLLKCRQQGKTCVVILDEAQDLDRDTLEAVRLLSNFETPDGKLLQIVLAGQPRILETLERADCEQIRQRINVISRLAPLSHSEVREYMAHRLKTAGGSVGVFTPPAIEAIATASGGVPRIVNTICFNALTVGYAMNQRQVGLEQVAEACHDLGLRYEAPAAPRRETSAPIAGSGIGASLALTQTRPSLRPACIAGAMVLLAIGAFVLLAF
ncbi:MAG TPA: AAA family ATPase [Bryobacteraceae bacterium]|nr:AAA family ATPase [Bryobacteraceae bacterium]